MMSLQKLCLFHISYERFLEKRFKKMKYLLFQYVFINEHGLYDDIQRIMHSDYPECVYVIFEVCDLVVIYSQCVLTTILNTQAALITANKIGVSNDFVDCLRVCEKCDRFRYCKANYMSYAMIDDMMIKHLIKYKEQTGYIIDKFLCIAIKFMENKFNLVIT